MVQGWKKITEAVHAKGGLIFAQVGLCSQGNFFFCASNKFKLFAGLFPFFCSNYFFLQLWFTGRASHSAFLNGETPVSASAIPIVSPTGLVHTPIGKKPHETPRALETSEIPGIIQQYVTAAINAKEAGFDGVEIHR
jgi:2,4-dienoyl-CoA reductase-like NADH-dependent reductase (Old Yellow Enzyme family)